MFMLTASGFFVATATNSFRIFVFFYSDPGSGAMLWQMIAAFFVGGLFYATFAFNKVKTFTLRTLGLGNAQGDLTPPNSIDKVDRLEN